METSYYCLFYLYGGPRTAAQRTGTMPCLLLVRGTVLSVYMHWLPHSVLLQAWEMGSIKLFLQRRKLRLKASRSQRPLELNFLLKESISHMFFCVQKWRGKPLILFVSQSCSLVFLVYRIIPIMKLALLEKTDRAVLENFSTHRSEWWLCGWPNGPCTTTTCRVMPSSSS